MAVFSWLTSSLMRNFPNTLAQRLHELTLQGALNEQSSFQVAMRQTRERQHVQVQVTCPKEWSLRVRRVGFVPVLHHNTPLEPAVEDIDGVGCIPGYVPDPLYDQDFILLPQNETHAFWITVRPDALAAPGEYEIKVEVLPAESDPVVHTVTVKLHDLVLKKRTNFAVTNWFYVDALIDWYKTDLFDERFWEILPRYLRDMAAHGQDTIYVPVFTMPTDGVKRPSQLLQVTRTGPDTYDFDWSDVERYVVLAQECGIEKFEWCHLITQWGAKNAIRIYEGQGREENLLWSPETEATSDTYRAFLAQFLPELHQFLLEKDILPQSFFHVSDEPHGELGDYKAARQMLKELAPWMAVMDALTEIKFAQQGLTDMPIPSIRTALDFVVEEIPCWCYYCCGPRGKYLNHLLDTPLSKIAMHGFLFYRWPFQGFLHWGYNYWYQSQTRTMIDPYTVQDGLAWQRGWAYGDTFWVYPGPDGPIDSIRWEIFCESLQDYALLQTLGIERDHELLDALHTFEDFPKTRAWRDEVRAKLLAMV